MPTTLQAALVPILAVAAAAVGQNATITGLALDEAGKPLAEVAVCAFAAHRPWQTSDLAATPNARTDAAGRFAIERTRLVGCDTMLFVSPGRVHVAVGISVVDMTPVILPRGSTLAGRVRDPSGQPLAGVRVQARDWLSQCRFLGRNVGAWFSAPEPATAVVTDAEGRFVLTGTVESAIALTVGNHGFEERHYGPLAAGQPLDATTAPAPMFVLEVRVGDTPASGVHVHVRPRGNEAHQLVGTTDQDGRLTITWPGAAPLEIHASNDQHFGNVKLQEPTDQVMLALQPIKLPQVPPRDVGENALTVRGTLRDPDTGGPVADAWVGVVAPAELRSQADGILLDLVSNVTRNAKARTGADGTFELRVPPGRWWLVAAEPSRRARPNGTSRNPTPRELQLPAGDAALTIDLALQPRTTANGRLVGGTVPPGAQLRLLPDSHWIDGGAVGAGFHDRFAIDDTGAVAAARRQPGAHAAQLLVPRGFRQGLPDRIAIGKVELPGTQPFELDIGKALPGTVRGRVRGEVPTERLAIVSLGGMDGPASQALFDGPVAPLARDGAFVLPEPPGQRWLVVFDLWTGVALHWTRPAMVAPASARDVEIDLRAHGVQVVIDGIPDVGDPWLDVTVDDAHWPADVGRIGARGKDPNGEIGVAVRAENLTFTLWLPGGDTELRLRKHRQKRQLDDLLDSATWSSDQPGERKVTLVGN